MFLGARIKLLMDRLSHIAGDDLFCRAVQPQLGLRERDGMISTKPRPARRHEISKLNAFGVVITELLNSAAKGLSALTFSSGRSGAPHLLHSVFIS